MEMKDLPIKIMHVTILVSPGCGNFVKYRKYRQVSAVSEWPKPKLKIGRLVDLCKFINYFFIYYYSHDLFVFLMLARIEIWVFYCTISFNHVMGFIGHCLFRNKIKGRDIFVVV